MWWNRHDWMYSSCLSASHCGQVAGLLSRMGVQRLLCDAFDIGGKQRLGLLKEGKALKKTWCTSVQVELKLFISSYRFGTMHL